MDEVPIPTGIRAATNPRKIRNNAMNVSGIAMTSDLADQVLFCDVLCFGERHCVAGRLYVERAVSATELCGQRPTAVGEFVVVAGELGADRLRPSLLCSAAPVSI